MLACRRPLSGQAMLPLWMFALIAVAMAMLMATTLVATRPDWSAAAADWLAGGWLALYLACSIRLAPARRRYRARAHPFVLDCSTRACAARPEPDCRPCHSFTLTGQSPAHLAPHPFPPPPRSAQRRVGKECV